MEFDMLIDSLTIQSDSSLKHAMTLIDQNKCGVCFVLMQAKLIGILTDGDVRRAILDGAKLTDLAASVMNQDFSSLPAGSDFSTIQNLLKRFKYVPIVDANGILVDIASASSYHQIPLATPVLDGNELEYITDCIFTGWVSSRGKYVDQFESEFSKYVGCSNSLAVSNGTVALHLALVALGIGPGDEVLVPNLTFAASVNAILYVGAIPILIDVDPDTLDINPDLIRPLLTKRTRAIMPVHLYGHPAQMDEIMCLARENNLLVIEDCAEALGSLYRDRHVGTFGDAATFSFFGNKTITTGEGGMIIFSNKEKYDKAKILRDHGMSVSRRYWHEEVGYNYRLTNIQAAIGVAQMEKVESFVDRKRWIAGQYKKYLAGNALIKLPIEKNNCLSSYWLYTVVLSESLAKSRDAIIKCLEFNGIESRPIFYPIHLMPPYQKFATLQDSYPVSIRVSECGISLPSFVKISEQEIERVCIALIDAISSVSQNSDSPIKIARNHG
jgi:perosamine synthetase